MKRIGILTFHRSINYGAYMQSYALSIEIKKRFPNALVEIIDFELLSKHQSYKRTTYIIPFYFEDIIKYNAFKRDLRKLPLSPETIISNDINKLLEYIKGRYEIVIVGSDAVWAFQKMKLNNPYWLFGNDLKDVVKMSFAASAYSTDFMNISINEKLFIKERLESFQYIGVRDLETYNFIKEIIQDKEIYLNNDPTFFLKKAENENLAKEYLKKNLIFTNKSIISFMTRRMPFINEVKKHLKGKYSFVHFSHRDKLLDIFNIRTRLAFNLSPIEWYNIYSICMLNFSQYFHGTIIGIINNIPTFSIDDTDFSYKYIGKNEQVMTDLKLKDFFFKTNILRSDKNEKDRLFLKIENVLKNIDYEKTRLELAVKLEVNKSESFFNALKTYI